MEVVTRISEKLNGKAKMALILLITVPFWINQVAGLAMQVVPEVLTGQSKQAAILQEISDTEHRQEQTLRLMEETLRLQQGMMKETRDLIGSGLENQVTKKKLEQELDDMYRRLRSTAN